jgi:hypothetical protein
MIPDSLHRCHRMGAISSSRINVRSGRLVGSGRFLWGMLISQVGGFPHTLVGYIVSSSIYYSIGASVRKHLVEHIGNGYAKMALSKAGPSDIAQFIIVVGTWGVPSRGSLGGRQAERHKSQQHMHNVDPNTHVIFQLFSCPSHVFVQILHSCTSPN